MRLWSLHPQYLDLRGLTACWREALLARKVLAGATVGYRNHPQLDRFRTQANPVGQIDCYLRALWEEATRRGYHFDRSKIGPLTHGVEIEVNRGQLNYERVHLLQKLRLRDAAQYKILLDEPSPTCHPLFRTTEGNIEPWERPVPTPPLATTDQDTDQPKPPSREFPLR